MYMKRKLLICGFITALIVFVMGCGKENFRIGTAAEGGVYNKFGDSISETMAENTNDFQVSVKKTAGTDANLRLLAEGYIQLAICQSDIL